MDICKLYVEGTDDKNVIISLLRRRNWMLEGESREVTIDTCNGVDRLLNTIPVALKASNLDAVGFVVDANSSVMSRWNQIFDKLGRRDILKTSVSITDGLIIGVPAGRRTIRAGVWVLPDNNTDQGKLEDLLESLIPKEDKLLACAETATDNAIKMGVRFPSVDRKKAVLHTWLAWQEKPGCPYGTAITARYFRDDSEVANKFVRWCEMLFRDYRGQPITA